MAAFHFELVSPEKHLFSGEVESVVAPGADGQFTVLKDHAPVMTTLKAGVVTVSGGEGKVEKLFVRGGFADVNASGFTILAEHGDCRFPKSTSPRSTPTFGTRAKTSPTPSLTKRVSPRPTSSRNCRSCARRSAADQTAHGKSRAALPRMSRNFSPRHARACRGHPRGAAPQSFNAYAASRRGWPGQARP